MTMRTRWGYSDETQIGTGARVGNCPWLCKIYAYSILCNLSVGSTRFYRIGATELFEFRVLAVSLAHKNLCAIPYCLLMSRTR